MIQPERFTVAIYAQIVTPESAAEGDVDRYEVEEEHETTYTLAELAWRLECMGISGHVEGGISNWFESLDPVSDRAHFELGEDKRYTAHVNRNERALSETNHNRLRRILHR